MTIEELADEAVVVLADLEDAGFRFGLGRLGRRQRAERDLLRRTVRPAEQTVAVREPHSDGLGVLEQAERDRGGDGPAGIRGLGWVGQRLGVRIGGEDPDHDVVGAIGVGLDPDGTGSGA